MIFSRTLLNFAAASALVGAALPSQALTVFDLNMPAGATYGQVFLTQVDSDTVHVLVDLSNGYNFVDTGSHFAFAFSAGAGATITGLTAGYTIAAGGPFDQSGFGTFGYAIACPVACQGGTNSNVPNDIMNFDVNRASITEASFTANGAGFAFTADLFGPNPTGGSMTFPVGAQAPVPAVPEPETYALLLAGLGVVGFMARRRKQQA